ncbi:MAG: class II aldolase/adducin family protein [Pseudolabrys sp.]|nr:class II aldolase/adducin family protein [Pseudolabrys sp.]
MAHAALKNKLIAAGKVLAAAGQGDFTRGHISVRMPGKPQLLYMKPHSVGLDEITPRNILTIALDGEVVAGKARRHSEVYIHSEIYKARPDVHCVIHSHSPYATALSAIGRPMKAYSQGGALFRGALGVYTDTIRLIRTSELGAGVAKALGPHRAVLLKNHGVAVACASIEEAVVSAIMLENAAMVQMVAEAAGEPALEFANDDIAGLREQLSRPEQFVINFDYLVRRLKTRR